MDVRKRQATVIFLVVVDVAIQVGEDRLITCSRPPMITYYLRYFPISPLSDSLPISSKGRPCC